MPTPLERLRESQLVKNQNQPRKPIYVPQAETLIARAEAAALRLTGGPYQLYSLDLIGFEKACGLCGIHHPTAGLKPCTLVEARLRKIYPSNNFHNGPYEAAITMCRDLDACDFRQAVRT